MDSIALLVLNDNVKDYIQNSIAKIIYFIKNSRFIVSSELYIG